jgi:hypothetical protein
VLCFVIAFACDCFLCDPFSYFEKSSIKSRVTMSLCCCECTPLIATLTAISFLSIVEKIPVLPVSLAGSQYVTKSDECSVAL